MSIMRRKLCQSSSCIIMSDKSSAPSAPHTPPSRMPLTNVYRYLLPMIFSPELGVIKIRYALFAFSSLA